MREVTRSLGWKRSRLRVVARRGHLYRRQVTLTIFLDIMDEAQLLTRTVEAFAHYDSETMIGNPSGR